MSQSMPHTDPFHVVTVQSHQPWCRNHHAVADESHDDGWCQNTVMLEYVADFDAASQQKICVNIEPRHQDEADPAIEVYVDEAKLNPDEARRLAAALVAAADLLERVAR